MTKPKQTLFLLIGIATGASIQALTKAYAGWILLFLSLFLLVIFAMQIQTKKQEPTPLEQI